MPISALRFLLLALMLAVVAPAAGPFTNEVTGLKLPERVEGEADDWITITAATEGKVVRWVSMDSGLKVFPTELLKDSKTVVVHARAPGNYHMMAYTAIGGEPTAPAFCTVAVSGVFPPPGPTPGPTPGPGPTPTPPPISKAWLLIVEETADAASGRGPFFTDKDLAHFLESKKNWKVKIVDKDIVDPSTNKTPASLVPWFAKLKDEKGNWKDLPWVMVIDQDGAVRHEGKVPKTPADLLAILKKL